MTVRSRETPITQPHQLEVVFQYFNNWVILSSWNERGQLPMVWFSELPTGEVDVPRRRERSLRFVAIGAASGVVGGTITWRTSLDTWFIDEPGASGAQFAAEVADVDPKLKMARSDGSRLWGRSNYGDC